MDVVFVLHINECEAFGTASFSVCDHIDAVHSIVFEEVLDIFLADFKG